MGFLKTVYDKLHPAPETKAYTNPFTRAQAEFAVERASQDLQEVERNETKVTEVVSSLKEQLTRDHFGEMVEASMRGRV